MILTVGCTMPYQVIAPTAAFTFNVLVNGEPEQKILTETIRCTPEVTPEFATGSLGARVLRLDARTGPFELKYTATVEVDRAPMPGAVMADQPGRLPLSILTYTLPSRYCESDRFAPHAWELFGRTDDRAEQVRAICRWIDANLEYAPGTTDGRTSAWDVWQTRKGVCRDFTHVAIALCRALSIPARYVGGYGIGLEPMDFHACFEAYLGGAWRLFDPTDGVDPGGIVVASRGRDAATAALTTIFGRVQAGKVTVECAPAQPAATLSVPA
jgi:transglutaminase-like putative cysteine protease